MPLSDQQIAIVEDIIRNSLRNKLLHYKPETKHMPFHYRLLGKDRMALYSFIQSLNTTFGISIFEPVAVSIANFHFPHAQSQYSVGNEIRLEAQHTIQTILNSLSLGKALPNKEKEIELIRKACLQGKITTLRTVKADLVIKDQQGTVYLIDLKTVKPNLDEFMNYKRTLLEWCAIYLTKYPNANVHSFLAIPYNPYDPKPYERWTMKGMLDINCEVLIAEEFWDFLLGESTYSKLLDLFELVCLSMRS